MKENNHSLQIGFHHCDSNYPTLLRCFTSRIYGSQTKHGKLERTNIAEHQTSANQNQYLFDLIEKKKAKKQVGIDLI